MSFQQRTVIPNNNVDQCDTGHNFGWHSAFAGIKGNPRLVVKNPPPKQPASEELEALAAMEGERLKAIFQAEINARCPSDDKNPIRMLMAAFPQLSNCGHGMTITFSRNIELFSHNKRLIALFSKNQLIALAAAKTLAPLIDTPPGNFQALFINCCQLAKTHIPELVPLRQLEKLGIF